MLNFIVHEGNLHNKKVHRCKVQFFPLLNSEYKTRVINQNSRLICGSKKSFLKMKIKL